MEFAFKEKLPEQGDTLSNFPNFPNYSSSESCIINKNCTSHCEVVVAEKESLQTPWPLRKLSRLYQHDICKYWGVIYTHRGKYFSCFHSAWLSKGKRQICMMRVYCAVLSSMWYTLWPYWFPSKDNVLLDSLLALLIISWIIVKRRCRIWHDILESRNRKC